MWFVLAMLSAICAALVAVFSKMGGVAVNVYLITSFKALLMAITIFVATALLHKAELSSLLHLSSKGWMVIVASGVVGGLGWLFYFISLEQGAVANVVAVNQWVIVFTFVLSFFLLGEAVSLLRIIGGILMVVGSYFIVYF